jgi:hypothetical protein
VRNQIAFATSSHNAAIREIRNTMSAKIPIDVLSPVQATDGFAGCAGFPPPFHLPRRGKKEMTAPLKGCVHWMFSTPGSNIAVRSIAAGNQIV